MNNKTFLLIQKFPVTGSPIRLDEVFEAENIAQIISRMSGSGPGPALSAGPPPPPQGVRSPAGRPGARARKPRIPESRRRLRPPARRPPRRRRRGYSLYSTVATTKMNCLHRKNKLTTFNRHYARP